MPIWEGSNKNRSTDSFAEDANSCIISFWGADPELEVLPLDPLICEGVEGDSAGVPPFASRCSGESSIIIVMAARARSTTS